MLTEKTKALMGIAIKSDDQNTIALLKECQSEMKDILSPFLSGDEDEDDMKKAEEFGRHSYFDYSRKFKTDNLNSPTYDRLKKLTSLLSNIGSSYRGYAIRPNGNISFIVDETIKEIQAAIQLAEITQMVLESNN